jgi:hypothetical protein
MKISVFVAEMTDDWDCRSCDCARECSIKRRRAAESVLGQQWRREWRQRTASKNMRTSSQGLYITRTSVPGNGRCLSQQRCEKPTPGDWWKFHPVQLWTKHVDDVDQRSGLRDRSWRWDQTTSLHRSYINFIEGVVISALLFQTGISTADLSNTHSERVAARFASVCVWKVKQRVTTLHAGYGNVRTHLSAAGWTTGTATGPPST